MLEVSILHNKLIQAGIPIDGIAKENGSYRIDFRPEATQNQRDQAIAIVAAFDPAEATAKEAEINNAPGIARNYFASHPVAIAFVRLSPAEQEAQIDAMTNTQMKTLLKYLTIAVSMLVKRELL